MFSQFQQAQKIVNQKLSNGAGNVQKHDETVPEMRPRRIVIDYYRELLGDVMSLLLKGQSKSLDKFQLLASTLLASFAELYKVGNCEEHAAVGLLELLMMGIGKLELISVEDKKSKTSHILIMHNREMKSKIDEPHTYGNVIFFDTWPGANKVKEFSGCHDDILSKEDFFNAEIKEVSTITSCLSINSFTFDDWNEIIEFLISANGKITETSIALLMVKHKLDTLLGYDSKQETAKIKTKISDNCTRYLSIAESVRPLPLSLLGQFSGSESASVCKDLETITELKWTYSLERKDAVVCVNDKLALLAIIDCFTSQDDLIIKKLEQGYEVTLKDVKNSRLKEIISCLSKTTEPVKLPHSLNNSS